MGSYVGPSPGTALHQLMDAIMPVGYIWQTSTSDDPNALYPGVWSKIAEGTFLVAAGGSGDYALGATGGEEAHQLISAELPAHNHSASMSSSGAHTHIADSNNTGAHTHDLDAVSWPLGGATAWKDWQGWNTGGAYVNVGISQSAGSHSHTINVYSTNSSHTHSISVTNTGSDNSHENRPPYLAVNTWERTA